MPFMILQRRTLQHGIRSVEFACFAQNINFFCLQAPVRVGRNQIRLMLQITSPRRAADKLKYLAGSEAAMGAWIGDIPPELGAQRLREAIEKADKEYPVGTLPPNIQGFECEKTSKANGNLKDS